MAKRKKSENGGAARVAFCAHPTHVETNMEFHRLSLHSDPLAHYETVSQE
jgi:hypothetical protein